MKKSLAPTGTNPLSSSMTRAQDQELKMMNTQKGLEKCKEPAGGLGQSESQDLIFLLVLVGALGVDSGRHPHPLLGS